MCLSFHSEHFSSVCNIFAVLVEWVNSLKDNFINALLSKLQIGGGRNLEVSVLFAFAVFF